MKEHQAIKWIGLVLGCIGFLSVLLSSSQKVVSGRGLDTFYNVYGLELNHIIVLVTLAVILPIAVLIGFGVQWWESWKERDFKRK
jgi:hypothetical protein